MRYTLALLLSFITTVLFAQESDTTLPFYKRFPTVTPFQVLLSDSSTLYTKAQLPEKKPVLMMIFSPECSHCQHEAETIAANKEALSGVHILMITMHPLHQMNFFATKYGLNALPNVVVGRDVYYLMPAFYKFSHLPFHALYNAKGNLVFASEGSMDVLQIPQLLKKGDSR